MDGPPHVSTIGKAYNDVVNAAEAVVVLLKDVEKKVAAKFADVAACKRRHH
jgi:hypothetical protein